MIASKPIFSYCILHSVCKLRQYSLKYLNFLTPVVHNRMDMDILDMLDDGWLATKESLLSKT